MFKYELVSNEGFFKDWRDRRELEKSASVSLKDADALLKKIDTVSDEDLNKILGAGSLQSVVTAHELVDYFTKGHFQFIKSLNQHLVPLWKQYGTLSFEDVKKCYDAGKVVGKVADLENKCQAVIQILDKDPAFKIVDRFSYGKKKEPLSARGYNKESLKAVLALYIKQDLMDYDKKCPGFIFAEDHDEGYCRIHYEVIDQLLEKAVPGADIEYEECFPMWRQSENFFYAIQGSYDEFYKEINYIVKRIAQILK